MKFRKKPVVIDAMQFNGWLDRDPPMAEFVNDYRGPNNEQIRLNQIGQLSIPTLEGTMYANAGDWIIKGIKGEFYPCKPDIFEATYEPVAEPEPSR